MSNAPEAIADMLMPVGSIWMNGTAPLSVTWMAKADLNFSYQPL